MTKRLTTEVSRQRRSGQVIVLFAGALLMVAGICVLAVDVGRLFLSKAELQNAVDAAALAGASQLIAGTTEAEKTNARTQATAFALANNVAGTSLHLASGDILFGHYESATGAFVPEPTATVVDSIKITGRRTPASADGPVDLFFGPIFGWDDQDLDDVVGVATKPRRYVMFVLDRSGSMCFDTSGVSLHATPNNNATGYYMSKSTSGWYALPQQMYSSGSWRTAYFWGRDDTTGLVRTNFLPPAIAATLVSGQYWKFSTGDSSGNNPSWVKVPADVTLYSRYATSQWSTSNYYSKPGATGYATSGGSAQPIQSVMDAACAFVNLLRPADDTAGLVTYASGATTNSILTADFASLETRLQTFSPCGATAEPDGMTAGLNELIDSHRADGYGQRIMVLLTDGQANLLSGTSYANTTQTFTFLGTSVTTKIHPTVAAAMATQANRAVTGRVRIYCVTFGADSDTAVHQRIANVTGGAFYHSTDQAALTDIFIDIFRRLPPVLTQ